MWAWPLLEQVLDTFQQVDTIIQEEKHRLETFRPKSTFQTTNSVDIHANFLLRRGVSTNHPRFVDFRQFMADNSLHTFVLEDSTSLQKLKALYRGDILKETGLNAIIYACSLE